MREEYAACQHLRAVCADGPARAGREQRVQHAGWAAGGAAGAWPYCSSCCTPYVDVIVRPMKQQQRLTAPGWPLQLMGPAGADAAILALGVAAEPWLNQPSLEVGLFLGREH